MHALSPRWRVGGRYDVAAPPDQSRALNPALSSLHSVEGLLSYRFSRDLILRGFFVTDRSFFDSQWDREAGMSFVMA